jgi:hypothetical protein
VTVAGTAALGALLASTIMLASIGNLVVADGPSSVHGGSHSTVGALPGAQAPESVAPPAPNAPAPAPSTAPEKSVTHRPDPVQSTDHTLPEPPVDIPKPPPAPDTAVVTGPVDDLVQTAGSVVGALLHGLP